MIPLEDSPVSSEEEKIARRARLTCRSSSFEVNSRKDEVENFSRKHHLQAIEAARSSLVSGF